MLKWSWLLYALVLSFFSASLAHTQGEIQQSPMLKAVLAKPRAVKLTPIQRRAMVTRSGGSFGASSPIHTLTPRTMVLANRASMLMHLCVLFWPAADAAFFERNGNFQPQIDFRIKVDPGVKYVIVSAGFRSDGEGQRTWKMNFRRMNSGAGSQTQDVLTSGATALASAVLKPTASGWWEGKINPQNDGAFCLDFLEFTMVK